MDEKRESKCQYVFSVRIWNGRKRSTHRQFWRKQPVFWKSWQNTTWSALITCGYYGMEQWYWHCQCNKSPMTKLTRQYRRRHRPFLKSKQTVFGRFPLDVVVEWASLELVLWPFVFSALLSFAACFNCSDSPLCCDFVLSSVPMPDAANWCDSFIMILRSSSSRCFVCITDPSPFIVHDVCTSLV